MNINTTEQVKVGQNCKLAHNLYMEYSKVDAIRTEF